MFGGGETKTDLVELEADQAGDERGGGRDRGDDLAGNLLGRVAVCGRDAVVHGAEVRRSGDEVDVEVRVVILLELDRVEAVTNERRWRWKLLDQIRKVRVCERRPVSVCTQRG